MLGRVQNSSGSGLESGQKFGFGFDRVCQFQQSSGSGLSGSLAKVRVLGFIGFGFDLIFKVNFKCLKIDGKSCNLV